MLYLYASVAKMKNPTQVLRIGSLNYWAHPISGDVLRPITAEDLVHLVFQLKFDFLQPMLLHFLFGSEMRFGFQGFQLYMEAMVLVRQPPEFLVGLHQVRLQFFLRVLHQGSVSFVS